MGVHCSCRNILHKPLTEAFEKAISAIGTEEFKQRFITSSNAVENRNTFLTENFADGSYNAERAQCPPCAVATENIFTEFLSTLESQEAACG